MPLIPSSLTLPSKCQDLNEKKEESNRIKTLDFGRAHLKKLREVLGRITWEAKVGKGVQESCILRPD